MQESPTPISSPAAVKHTPLHDEIAQCARDLWLQEGQPVDRDLAIWLDAERRLLAATTAPRESDPDLVAPLEPPPTAPARSSSRPVAVAGSRAVKAPRGEKRPAK